MAVNQNQSQPNNPQPTNDGNPMSSFNGGSSYNNDNVYKLLSQLTQELCGKAPASGRRPTRNYTSQSSYADKQAKWKFDNGSRTSYHRHGNILDDFEQGIKDQLLDSLAGGDFKKSMQSALNTFTKEFGVELKDLPHELGKNLGKQFMDSKFGQQIGEGLKKKAQSMGNTMLNKMFDGAIAKGGQGGLDAQAAKDALTKVIGAFGKGGGQAGATVATQGGATVAAQGNALNGLMGGMKVGAKVAGPWALLIYGILKFIEAIQPAIAGLGTFVKSLGSAMKAEEDARKKRLETATKRMEADMESIVRRPFEIMEEAAKEWASTWDANLAKVSLTQGYTKENVYGLYSNYAQQLIDDGLSSVISATDISSNLSKVLDAGLSGTVAEAFAYTASKLNALVPTEDFFGYASSYASLAANALAEGASQQEAINYANSQLELFASNLLYSSRELTGGFSTGLKNASDLFNQSVEIARTARTTNVGTLSGTLTSVSAIIGAVAPELANGLVNNVVNAAIGGNNSNFVALRSLAGINAGNTEFLQAMVENPQEIFTKIFTNLANMQNMSPDNYMEVAEGLADVFGVDMKAFAQVDFNYLAQAISSMSVSYASLDENLKLLQSGDATTLAEQQKMSEINQMILDEGLAYVIDNEAARVIQQHMWDEQLANELQENTYAVELKGAAMEALEGVRQTVTNLLNYFNPIAWLGKSIDSLAAVVQAEADNDQDLREILELGAIGSNARSLYNLTTRGSDLGLVRPLVEMMGGEQGTQSLMGDLLGAAGTYYNVVGNIVDVAGRWIRTDAAMASSLIHGEGLGDSLLNAAKAEIGFDTTSDQFNDWYYNRNVPTVEHSGELTALTSSYTWTTVGKSIAKGIQSSPINNANLGSIGGITSAQSAYNTQQAVAQSNNMFQTFLGTMEEAVQTMTYEEWVRTARDYGISDYEEALENYGRTDAEIRSLYAQYTTKAGAEVAESRAQDEVDFRNQMRDFWDLESGTSGMFQAVMWNPFFGDNQKYDTRMDAVDTALSAIQSRIGIAESHTVISGLEEISNKIGVSSEFTVLSVLQNINSNLEITFIRSTSAFQMYLAGWAAYRASVETYNKSIGSSSEWDALVNAEEENRTQTTLALANALQAFSAADLQKLDPQLQANALLGQIVVILQAIMQQNNNPGGVNFIDSLQAMGFGVTTQT